MRWEMELQQKYKISLLVLWQLFRTLSFRFSEEDAAEISVPQHHTPGTVNGHGNYTNLKMLHHSMLVDYILETIQDNLLTASTAKYASARIDPL
jgi:hypothetical protein